MAFDIMSLNRNRSAIQAKSRADEQAGRAVLKYLDVDDLVPSTENFYSMSAIEELAFLIALSGGIKQPGLAVPLGGGKYRLIAGHRRRLASVLLVERGKQEYKKMPCIVETVHGEEPKDVAGIAEEEALREIDEAILLMQPTDTGKKQTGNGYRRSCVSGHCWNESGSFRKSPVKRAKSLRSSLERPQRRWDAMRVSTNICCRTSRKQ